MNDTYIKIIVAFGFALITWLTERIIKFINGKIKSNTLNRFLFGAITVVSDAVKATYQETVESLKKSGTFDKDAQKQALEDAKSKIRLEMSTKMKQYIEDNVGDFEIWMDTTIHSTLYDLKK